MQSMPTRMVVQNWYAPRERSPDDDDHHDYDYVERPPLFGTFCVRLCDGFYWPLSHSTTSQNFGRDKVKCERSCPGAPVRLFVNPMPGGAPDVMQDLSGMPYPRLKTAFGFQTGYESSCRCTAQPWDQASKDRHRVYALEAAQRKGDANAADELVALRGRIEADNRSLTAQSKAMRDQLVSSRMLTPAQAAESSPDGKSRPEGLMGLGQAEPPSSNRGGQKGRPTWVNRVFEGH